MAFRFTIFLLAALICSVGHCQTIQRSMAKRPHWNSPTCNCVSYEDLVVVKTALQALQLDLIELEKQGLKGPAGPMGPPGRSGSPGASGATGPAGPGADLAVVNERIVNVENQLNEIVDYLNEQITKQKESPHKPLPFPERSKTKQSAAVRTTTEEKNETPWITNLLGPLATVVGTAYAGPAGGAIASSVLGLTGWLLFRKKKRPRQFRQRFERPPPQAYSGSIVQPDGTSEYVDSPDPDLYREAVEMAAGGKTGVLGDRAVGVDQLRWIANKNTFNNKT